MIFPVKVYTPEGTLKEVISKETLIIKHWKEIDIDIQLIRELKNRKSHSDEPLKPKVKYKKVTPTVCAIWLIKCGYVECRKPAVKRSAGGRYCNDNCLRLEANRRRRKDK